jgi:hypothetical protein
VGRDQSCTLCIIDYFIPDAESVFNIENQLVRYNGTNKVQKIKVLTFETSFKECTVCISQR